MRDPKRSGRRRDHKRSERRRSNGCRRSGERCCGRRSGNRLLANRDGNGCRHRRDKGLGRELRGCRRGRRRRWWLGCQWLDLCWRRRDPGGDGTGRWRMSPRRPPPAGLAACADTVSPLNAEPAARDSAAPTIAKAAAEMVNFFACDTNQGRSRRKGGSIPGVSSDLRGMDGERTDRHQCRTAGEGQLCVDGVENRYREGVSDGSTDRVEVVAGTDEVQALR